MHQDLVLPEIIKVLVVIAGFSLIMRRLKQLCAYIFAGVCLGPTALVIKTDIKVMSCIAIEGSLGLFQKHGTAEAGRHE